MAEVDRDTLFSLSDALQISAGRPSWDAMDEWQQTFCLIWTLQSEINNGGFDQFFFNSSGDHAADTVDALKRIGADTTAELVTQALSSFPEGCPSEIAARRDLLLDHVSKKAKRLWSDLDAKFYRYPDPIEELLMAYLQENMPAT